MVAPIVFDNKIYSKYDFYDLKYSKKNKTFLDKKIKKNSILPSGDFCVDAVNATTMLIRVEALKRINGWDNNYYVYLEDIDICLRLKLNNYSIIKIADAKVDHLGWSSHFAEIKDMKPVFEESFEDADGNIIHESEVIEMMEREEAEEWAALDEARRDADRRSSHELAW